MAGRPRKYTDDAHKQWAYRQRQQAKADLAARRSDIALVGTFFDLAKAIRKAQLVCFPDWDDIANAPTSGDALAVIVANMQQCIDQFHEPIDPAEFCNL